MILPAVFLLSLSTLAFEVLLARVFSIGQWNHLSFMVISIALFGFAASGAFLYILDARQKGWENRLASNGPVKIMSIFYAVTVLASFAVLNRIPLDYFRLPLEPIQTLYLLTAYVLLALPFFFTGLVVTVAYASIPEKTGFVYFTSMTGSALGAILPVLILPVLGEGRLIILAALIPLTIVPFNRPATDTGSAAWKRNFLSKRWALSTISSGIVLIAVFLFSPAGDTVVKVIPSPYKMLSQVLEFPDTRITKTINSIKGRFDSVQSPYIRFAPGLSLQFKDILPEQKAIFKDGDNPFFLYEHVSRQNEWFSKFTLSFAGYALAPDLEHVLLIQYGGGSGIPCALASGASKITIVEKQPHIARIVQSHYNIPVVIQNPRVFLAQSQRRFSIIQVENWGSTLPGATALTQEYPFTVETFRAYVNHLAERGILILSRKLLLPPADLIRLWAAAHESLASLGVKNPSQHIAVLRNWSTFTLIISKKPFEDMAPLKAFAGNLNFDIVYMPGVTLEMANRFNVFDAPYHFLEIERLAAAYRNGTEKTYFKTYPLDVAPQTDKRPFPSRFLKWSRLKALYKASGSRFYSLFMSGEIVVAVVFVEAMLVAALLLVLPLFAILKKGRRPFISHILYFLAVGAGFMFVELYFIKKYIFIFGDPVVSFAVVLTGILVFSGLGGYCSQHVGPHGLRYALIILIAVLILIFFGLDPIIYSILKFSKFVRYFLALLLLFPSGFLLGLPFPLGMQYLLKRPDQRAYAWAANGCASVLTSILCAQIALSFGIPTIIACAFSVYFLALLCTVRAIKVSIET
jgi:hypothetical protein